MRTFTPLPALKAWYDAVRPIAAIAISQHGKLDPAPAVSVPSLPARPADPEQAAFYDNILVPIRDALAAYNAAAGQHNQLVQNNWTDWTQFGTGSAP